MGTLPRLIEAVRQRAGSTGVGIDENTVLIVAAGGAVVAGRGQVWRVAESGNGAVEVTPFRAGQRVTLPQ